jgi:hypothetical protein
MTSFCLVGLEIGRAPVLLFISEVVLLVSSFFCSLDFTQPRVGFFSIQVRCNELKYLFNSFALNLLIASSNVFSALLLSSG